MAIVSTDEKSDWPRTLDVHTHALSPSLVELTGGRRGPLNPHNDYLMQMRFKTRFEFLGVPA